MIALAVIAAVLGLTLLLAATGALVEASILGHPLIAVAYFTLAAVFAFVKLPGRTETALARVGAVLFFTGCGIHHLDMGIHIIDETRLEAADFHHGLATVMQVVGAPLFLFAIGPWVRELSYLLKRPEALKRLRRERKAG